MAEITSLPLTEPSAGGIKKMDLHSRLDELLEQYLNTLDEYQKEQQKLSKLWSSAHMSLAQAQFQNQTHVRYGQDYYDERMQAIRKVMVSEDDSRINYSVSSPQSTAVTEAIESTSETEKDASRKFAEISGSPNEGAKSKADRSRGMTKPRDPLRWFGILIPFGLRTAQASFVSVVEGPIPRLATLSKELRSLEIDIGRLRKQIKKS